MADDDDGHEAFEVNDADLEYALNPGRRHFQTKDQAIYGMWSARDDSDDDGPSSGPAYKKSKYSAPMSFVSGGVQKNSSTKLDKDDPSTLDMGTFTSKRENNDEAIDLNFGRRTKKQPNDMGAQVFAGMRSSATAGTVDPNKFGDWMKHGKGSVVMKMMESMGYKHGTGLGADGQGIIEPVQAALRKGRGAVGAYGKEMTGPKFGESAADAQKRLAGQSSNGSAGGPPEKETVERAVTKGGWKKSLKVKTRYKTLEEVLEEGSSGGSVSKASAAHAQTKVIDMTGPQQKIYSGYDSFAMKTKSEYEVDTETREVFDVPELLHNLNLLIDLTEDNIRRNNNRLLNTKDQSTALEYDLKQLDKALETEENEEKRIKEVYTLIDGFSSNNSPTMVEVQSLFTKLRAEYPEEYRIYNLEAVAIPIVLPLLVQYFSKWRPLDREHVIYGVELMREWKEILVDDSSNSTFGMNKNSFDEIPAYDRLLWEGWLPYLRKATLDWDPRDQMEDMLELIETWIQIIPVWIKENILEQVIVPRITERVNSWDPTRDTVPIHSWLVPWLHVLGDRLQNAMSPIRQKLAKALKMWDPQDRSAIGILRPWKEVWATGTFTAFLAQNIVPKLAKKLQEMQLDPRANPDCDEFKAVMEWLELVHPDAIVNVVTKVFFPRFYETLCRWLDSPGVNLAEVKMWYGVWRGRIPQELMHFPAINECLRSALAAIGNSMKGMRVSNLPPPPTHAPGPQPPRPMHPMMAPAQQLSLKDVIEMTAARNGFTYHPQKDRFKDGRQVFWFGSVSIYLDAGIVYVMDPTEFIWRPSGLDELIHLAQGSG